MICSCVKSNDDPVTKAEDAYANGDYEYALRQAESIVSDSAVFNSLNAIQLCRLSELYVNFSDNDEIAEIDANDASAARCLTRARALQSDSVTAFLQSRSGEMAGRLIVLDQVGVYLDTPRDSLVSSEDILVDSINMHDHE